MHRNLVDWDIICGFLPELVKAANRAGLPDFPGKPFDCLPKSGNGPLEKLFETRSLPGEQLRKDAHGITDRLLTDGYGSEDLSYRWLAVHITFLTGWLASMCGCEWPKQTKISPGRARAVITSLDGYQLEIIEDLSAATKEKRSARAVLRDYSRLFEDEFRAAGRTPIDMDCMWLFVHCDRMLKLGERIAGRGRVSRP